MTTETKQAFSLNELMCVIASRELQNGDVVFAGYGLPLVATYLAQCTHAAELVFITETGNVRTTPPSSLPRSVDDLSLSANSDMATGLPEVTAMLARGEIKVGFLGGAQVDRFGNLNSTVIGSYQNPKVRLMGSGGANDIATFAQRTILILNQERPGRFVDRVDYITSPGYLTGPGAREKAGFTENSGPSSVVTNKGVYHFDDDSKEMYLASYHPGVTIDEIKELVSWDLKIAVDVHETPIPTIEEIDLLRNKIDPNRFYI
ncbi:CoA-transferase [Fictibacillus sp. B-59209]|uniref:CoA-transferase subunit beta n=1 Tax=Fictibacillus sp. B-59209 TaxID=3024873 RepID=UPI002E246BC1|nr:CoA-transferase [Fictibacillus sp. B-59209]